MFISGISLKQILQNGVVHLIPSLSMLRTIYNISLEIPAPIAGISLVFEKISERNVSRKCSIFKVSLLLLAFQQLYKLHAMPFISTDEGFLSPLKPSGNYISHPL
jgi:hypothetical protein